MNLSPTGVGFRRKSLGENTEQVPLVRGQIEVAGETFAFEAAWVHATGEVVGFKFVTIEPAYVAAFMRFFDAELAGARLIEMDSSLLKQEEEGQVRYFQGRGCEIYWIQSSDSEIREFNLSFLGHYFEWERGKALRYGCVIEQENKGKASFKGSDLVGRPLDLTPQMAEAARRFVVSVPELPAPAREVILREIARASGARAAA